jgi:lipid II:glycine glycyltransferase (peptidoglycan interpeptide bridge formation enzyme)
VITVTDGWRQTLIARGVPADKVSVVMNVADARMFRGRRLTDGVGSRAQRGGSVEHGETTKSQRTRRDGDRRAGTGLRLLYHGTFTRRYGVDLLVDAIALVRDDLPDVHLTLLGDGDLRPDLVAQRDRLGLGAHVTISDGMVDAADLPAAIREADAGVVPTRSDVFTDGLLPTKLMELVAMGTPVIAARTPTVTSYFDDDMLQFFTPDDAGALADAIRALAADPQRRAILADNADAFNRKYDSASTAAGYVGVVDIAIRGRSAPTATLARAGVRGRVQLADRSARTSDAPAGIRITASSATDDAAWDAFLCALPTGHHTQTALWAQVKDALGWHAARVVAERDGQIIGGAQILYRRLPRLGPVGYVSRGPVLATDDPGLGEAVLREVERVARDLRIRYLTVQPPGVGESVPGYLAARGYMPSSTEVAPRATVIVDVTPELDRILAAMAAKTRYNVRLSGRKSVTVREGGFEDLHTYHRLLRATAARRGFTAQPKDYFETMWRVLAPRGHIRLAFAEHDGEVLSGQIAVAFGDTVVNKLSVWSGQAGNRRPNEALQWSTITWAHAHGFRHYDLEGLKLQAAQSLARGERLPATAEQSVTSFKLGFGGEVVLMPGAHVYVPNRALRWAFTRAYPRIADLRTVKSVVKGLRSGSAQTGTREDW